MLFTSGFMDDVIRHNRHREARRYRCSIIASVVVRRLTTLLRCIGCVVSCRCARGVVAVPLYPCLRFSPPVDHVRVITTMFIIFGSQRLD